MIRVLLECNHHPKYKAVKPPSKCPSCRWIYDYTHPKDEGDIRHYGALAFGKDGKRKPYDTAGYRSHNHVVDFRLYAD